MRKLLARLSELLNGHKIKFLVFGGIASVKYGVPRATFDIDIVLKKDTVPKNFLGILEHEKIHPVEGFTFNEFINSQYSVFKDHQGNEIDFWLRVDGFEFDEDSWDRRVDEKIDKTIVHFMSPEDIVSSKLSITPTESDIIDIMSILVTNLKNFNMKYFSGRIRKFKLKGKLMDLIPKMKELMDEEDIKPYITETINLLKKAK